MARGIPGQRFLDAAVVPLVVIVAILTRFLNLTTQSLWIDEGSSLEYARIASFGEVLGHVLSCRESDCFSPLYPLLLHPLIVWFGDSVAVLRGFSAICGVAAVLALTRASRLLFDASTSQLTGLLFAVSAFAVWYSQEARAYSLLLLLTSLELWAFALCLQDGEAPRWRYRLSLALAVALGVFGNILTTLGAVALCAAHFLLSSDHRRWLTTWWPAALAGMFPVLFFGITQMNGLSAAAFTPLRQGGYANAVYVVYGQLVGITFGPPQAALRAGEKLPVFREHILALVCAGALGLLLVIVLAAAVRPQRPFDPGRRNGQILAVSMLIGAALASALATITHMNWQPRHAFFLFPSGLVLISFGIREGLRAPKAWLVAVTASALALFTVTNLWSLYNYFEDSRYAKDDYRGAARVLIASERAGTPSALLAGNATLLRYYGDTSTVNLENAGPDELQWRLAELARPKGEVLVALNREFYWRGGIGVRAVLDSAFEIRKHQTLQYFDFYLLEPRR